MGINDTITIVQLSRNYQTNMMNQTKQANKWKPSRQTKHQLKIHDPLVGAEQTDVFTKPRSAAYLYYESGPPNYESRVC